MALENRTLPNVGSAKQYLLDILAKYPKIYSDAKYAIAAAWGYIQNNTPTKAMDIFSYRFDIEWEHATLVKIP